MSSPPTTAPVTGRAAHVREAGVSVTLVDHPTLCHGFLRFTGASPQLPPHGTSRWGLVARLARGAITDQIADQMNTIAGSVAHAAPVP